MSIEFVIFTPMVFLVLALIVVCARIAEVNGVLDTGTRDAARAASQAPDATQARSVAEQVVRDEVGTGSGTCLSTLSVTIQGSFTPGSTITVNSTCTYPISDAGVPGAPGDLTVHSRFSSVIDPNRTVG